MCELFFFFYAGDWVTLLSLSFPQAPVVQCVKAALITTVSIATARDLRPLTSPATSAPVR